LAIDCVRPVCPRLANQTAASDECIGRNELFIPPGGEIGATSTLRAYNGCAKWSFPRVFPKLAILLALGVLLTGCFGGGNDSGGAKGGSINVVIVDTPNHRLIRRFSRRRVVRDRTTGRSSG
jgi:hypothetical protein